MQRSAGGVCHRHVGGAADAVNQRGILLPSLALVINAFIWGVSWWPLRELQGYGLHPLWATALVYGLVFKTTGQCNGKSASK